MKLVQNPPVAVFGLWVNTWLVPLTVFRCHSVGLKSTLPFASVSDCDCALRTKLEKDSTLLKFKFVGY